VSKITLFGSATCRLCREVKKELAKHKIVVEEISLDTDEGYSRLLDEVQKQGLSSVPAVMPVITKDGLMWSGEDCLVAIREKELQ
jgi:glutaredoxin